MCGIVHNPATRKHFQEEKEKGMWQNLPSKSVARIAYLCEETRIPERACTILLNLADKHLQGSEKFITSQQFAIYKDGKRIVSNKSVADEQDVRHLSMAGSTMYFINLELKPLGIKLVMMCCCGAEIHSLREEAECMELSHQGNVWRATELRKLKPSDYVVVTDDEFNCLYGETVVVAYA